MQYLHKHFKQQGAMLQAAIYHDEFHIMLHVEPRGELFEDQLQRLYAAEDSLTSLPEFAGAQCVLKRYFLTDSTNQVPLMRQEPQVALSFIQQPPLDGSKVAVWIYMQRGATITAGADMLACEHGGYQHLWQMGLTHPKGDSAQQTQSILQTYEQQLISRGATLAQNCVRTWFYVRDVDTQYAGMVKARCENFTAQNLTPYTHYIASTGIQGIPSDPRASLQFDAYAIAGAWQPRQQRYLYAPTHLNPTHEYGVTFERGVCIDYGDRAHALISGTASISNRGEVLHVGNIQQQTLRMWENVETLLSEADMTFTDVAHIIVYLRDVADYAQVSRMFRERFPLVPTVITLAPVCRPAWLIEMECMAIAPRSNPDYAKF